MNAIVTRVCLVAGMCMLTAGARADTPLSKKPDHAVSGGDAVKWTLRVGDQTYAMRREGGAIPLPSELDWSCRYSQPRTKNHKGTEETLVHVTCTRSDSRFSFTPACTRATGKDGAQEPVQSSSSQSVTLYTGNQIVLVSVSCGAE